MYVFIDESVDSSLFVLGGLCSIYRSAIAQPILRARQTLRKRKRNGKHVPYIAEFSDYLLFNHYPDIEQLILNDLGDNSGMDIRFFYVWTKHNNQKQTNIYTALIIEMINLMLNSLVEAPSKVFHIIAHEYGDRAVREKIRNLVLTRFPNNNIRLEFHNSAQIKELQMADIVTGVARRHLNKEDKGLFDLVQPLLYETKYYPYSKLKT